MRDNVEGVEGVFRFTPRVGEALGWIERVRGGMGRDGADWYLCSSPINTFTAFE